MRQRNLARSTRRAKAISFGSVESQYLVGSFSPLGHSINSHSSGQGSLRSKSRLAMRSHRHGDHLRMSAVAREAGIPSGPPDSGADPFGWPRLDHACQSAFKFRRPNDSHRKAFYPARNTDPADHYRVVPVPLDTRSEVTTGAVASQAGRQFHRHSLG
jgi:hypothetical protein